MCLLGCLTSKINRECRSLCLYSLQGCVCVPAIVSVISGVLMVGIDAAALVCAKACVRLVLLIVSVISGALLPPLTRPATLDSCDSS